MSKRRNRTRRRKSQTPPRPAPSQQAWRAWRDDRSRELIEAGVPVQLAHDFANREAAGRQRIALIVGNSAAMKAELLAEDVPGGTKFHLTGMFSEIRRRGGASRVGMMLNVGDWNPR